MIPKKSLSFLIVGLLVVATTAAQKPKVNPEKAPTFAELTEEWKGLKKTDLDAKATCISKIGQLRTDEGVTFLSSTLTTETNVRLRRSLIYGLGLSPENETTRSVFDRIMKEESNSSDQRACLSYIRRVSPDWRETVLRILSDSKDQSLYSGALYALAGARDDVAFKKLYSLYQREEVANRKYSIASAVLSYFPVERTFEIYIKPNLKPKSPVSLRRSALQALSRARDERLFKYLRLLQGEVEKSDTMLSMWPAWSAVFDSVEALKFSATLLDADGKRPRTESAFLKHIPKMKSPAVQSWFRTRGTRSTDPIVRLATALHLESYPAAEDSKLLVKMSKSKNRRLAKAATRALAKHHDELATSNLRKLISHKNVDLADAALRASWVQQKGSNEIVESCLKIAKNSRSWQMRMVAIELLREKHAGQARKVLFQNAKHSEPLVRAAAFDALTYVRDKEVVEFLLELLKYDKSRSRFDLADALADLTGFTWGVKHERWMKWWSRVRDEYPLPPKPDKKASSSDDGYAGYYGISVKSERVAFIIDISGSMGAAVKTTTRLEEAKSNLISAINGFGVDTRFCLIAFHSVLIKWQDSLTRATTANKKEAVLWTRKLQPVGGTNIYDALMAGLDLKGVDTIFFLSDGAPGAGPVTDTTEILRRVRETNRFKRIRINTIGVRLQGAMREFLEKLAAENFGESRIID